LGANAEKPSGIPIEAPRQLHVFLLIEVLDTSLA
jgi:hypothetical protein